MLTVELAISPPINHVQTNIPFFDDLPLEIIKHIFLHLNEPCSLSSINRGCRELAKLWYQWEAEKLTKLHPLEDCYPLKIQDYKRTLSRLHFIAGHFFCDRFADYHSLSLLERYRWECQISHTLVHNIEKQSSFNLHINTITLIRLVSMKLNIDMPQPFYGYGGIGISSKDIEEMIVKIERSRNLNTITKLNAAHKGLFFVPTIMLKHLTTLTVLNFGINMIFRLPKEIGLLTNLKKLNLPHNFLEDLPNEMGKLLNLTKLNVGYNHLRRIPKCVFRLTNLQKLQCHANRITKLSKKIKYLSNLVELNLNRNYIKTLPFEIHKLQNLRELLLIHNKIERLPDSFSLLMELKTVRLSGNPLMIRKE